MQQNISSKSRKSKLTFDHYLGIPYYLVLLILVVIPIFLLVLASFQSEGYQSGIFPFHFTLEHYQSFLAQAEFVRSMTTSIWISVGTTIGALLIGYPLAYFLTQMKPKTAATMLILINAPMWINTLLRIRALQTIFDLMFPFLMDSAIGIITGLIYLYLPFMVLPIYTVLSKIDKNLLESSSDLGASKRQTFVKVIVPLSLSGVISGVLMVLLPAATTIIVPQYIAPKQNIYMIGTLIEKKVMLGGKISYGSAVAIVLSLIILGMVYYIRKLDKYKGVNQNEREEQ